ncbi:1-phosphatidylinositol 4,5-bisphosphate phosphodiesterase delta-1 [Cichlidogyrus casuarinus]|uniref:Phosphoinositide phospholipase C n=1 Tax=Cichlidogyrus casuarinus TaxID=1844966 RepID=A0ABD2QIM3_9PLAT
MGKIEKNTRLFNEENKNNGVITNCDRARRIWDLDVKNERLLLKVGNEVINETFAVDDEVEWSQALDEAHHFKAGINPALYKAEGGPILADLVVYCNTRHYRKEYIDIDPEIMISMHYVKIKSFYNNSQRNEPAPEAIKFASFLDRHLARIYPTGFQVDSSNYDPMPLFAMGCQMVALNFQTPSNHMHLNQGRFMDNGGCGYVLRTGDPRRSGGENNTREIELFIEIFYGINFPPCDRGTLAISFAKEPWATNKSCLNCIYTKGACKTGVLFKDKNAIRSKIYNPDFALMNIAFGNANRGGPIDDMLKSPLAQVTIPVHGLLLDRIAAVPMLNKYGSHIMEAALVMRVSKTGFSDISFNNLTISQLTMRILEYTSKTYKFQTEYSQLGQRRNALKKKKTIQQEKKEEPAAPETNQNDPVYSE